MSVPLDINAYLEEKRALIEDWLAKAFPSENAPPSTIHQAMRYSLMARSKRIRPVLTLATTESLGGKVEKAIPFACALELIHTYSLIHDDLPAMDNDDFRRGRPSNHKVFGEAMAILAGDALLTHAFYLMSIPYSSESTVASESSVSSESSVESTVSPRLAVEIITEIARAAGTEGMIGGQVMDIQLEGQSATISQVEAMHHGKTGAMILAAIRIGGLVANVSEKQMESLTTFGRHIGLAFQIVDDILNVEGNPEKLGKSVGSDRTAKKSTFPSVLGLQESKACARSHYEQAVQALELFGERAQILRALARFIICREF
jgi:geranylgeranyl diphosphate synthase type II